MQTTQRLFTNYISAGVQASLDRVRAAEYIVPEADRQQAWHILSFALDAPTAWQVTRELLLALAPKMEQAGFREEWIPYLEKGLHCAQNIGDRQAAAECELQIGLLYRLLSRFDEAKHWVLVSLEHFQEQHNSLGQVRVHNELAWQEHLLHYYDAANAHLDKALSLCGSNFATAFQAEQAVSYRIQGMIAIGQRNWSQAQVFHQKALELFQQVGDIRRSAWSLQNIGYALSEQGQSEDAIKYFVQADQTLNEIGDYYHRSIVQMNLGIAYQRIKEPELAIKCFSNAQHTFHQHGDRLNLAKNFTNLGLVSLDTMDYAKAEDSFIKSAKLYEELRDTIWYINALDGLALALIGSSQYEQAIHIITQAVSMLPEIEKTSYYDNLRSKLINHGGEAKLSLANILPTKTHSR